MKYARIALSVLVVSAMTLVAAGGTKKGPPAGVPPQPTRPVVAPPTEHPPVVNAPAVPAPPVDVPTPPEEAAGQPGQTPQPPFDVQDLLALLDAWGACAEGGACEWDLNGDGNVNWRDLTQLVRDLE